MIEQPPCLHGLRASFSSPGLLRAHILRGPAKFRFGFARDLPWTAGGTGHPAWTEPRPTNRLAPSSVRLALRMETVGPDSQNSYKPRALEFCAIRHALVPFSS